MNRDIIFDHRTLIADFDFFEKKITEKTNFLIILVSRATKWIQVSWTKKYHIRKFVVQMWVRPTKNGVNRDRWRPGPQSDRKVRIFLHEYFWPLHGDLRPGRLKFVSIQSAALEQRRALYQLLVVFGLSIF